MYNNRISPEPDPEQSRTRSGSADLSIHSSLGSFTAGNSEDKTDTGQRSLQGERSPQGQSQNDTEQNQGSGMSQHSEEKPVGESEEHVGGISWEQNLNRSDDQGDNSGEMELTPGDYREIDNNSRLSDIDDKTALILPDESVIYKDKKSHLDSPKVTLAVKKQLNEEAELFEMQTTDSNLQRETEKKMYLEAAEKKTQPESDLRHRRHGDIEEKTSYHEVIIGGGGEEGEGEIGCCGWILTILSFMIVVLTLPFSMFFCIKVVQEYERAVIFRLGRLLSGGAKGPGIFFILPCIESYTKVDLRTVSFDVPPQEILTRDSVTVSVDAVVYYRVSNPTVSVANVENAHHATRLLAQTTLRNILGTKNMSEILTERETISNAMQSVLDGATDRWGIKVERVEIKDVRLPLQLQRAMAAEAEASREARAKVLAAEGEHLASRSLKEAADMISQSPAAIQLRYLQTLNSISAEKNSTIIFPLPIDLIKSFMGGEFNKKSNSKSSTTIM